jgi:excinuclease ABC subunit C
VSSDLIRGKLSQLPHKPGIYLMKDRFGTVIYVGKARDLRKRVSQYFHPSRRQGWDLKLNALVEAIHDFDIHVVRSEPEALLLEGKLIKEFKPRYNVSFRDDKRFLLIKVNLNDPIPRFTLTRIQTDDGARYFGPFVHSLAARRTLALANRQFRLRGCNVFTPGEADYKHCLYAHLRYCTAPCIGNVSLEQYRMQVTAACDFLAGQCEELAQQLEQEMKTAAAEFNYEKAALLRDTLSDLRSTTKKTQKFPRLPYTLPLAIDPERDLVELAAVLKLPSPPQRIEGFDISNISGTFVVASLVSFRQGKPDRANYRRYQIKSVAGQDDFASVAEAVRRRYSRLLKEAGIAAAPGSDAPAAQVVVTPESASVKPEYAIPPKPNDRVPSVPAHASQPPGNFPDLILIDGGKGQLHAAQIELEKLGLITIPLIGLAKEFEEIFQPGCSEPLRLKPGSGALKLLQRVRDESHRFANTYNAQLRLRKISESILDEFPGIGAKRKADLLRKFGSVQRLRLASEETIAQVPGFGGEAAAKLKAFLMSRSPLPSAAGSGPGP